MGYTIAIAGKGGVGKSTLASLIIRILARRSIGSVLGVDADPNSNLAEFLGVAAGTTVGQVLDEISQHKDGIPAGMTKDRFIEYQIQTIIAEAEGFDVLTMGRPEGPGCYCYVNNILRNVIAGLIKEYSFVVIDNEAGLEHLSRKTTSSADVLLVVSDASAAGLRAAQRISDLALELKLKIKKRLLVINRWDQEAPEAARSLAGLAYAGCIPADERIAALSVQGSSLSMLETQSPAYVRLCALVDTMVRAYQEA